MKVSKKETKESSFKVYFDIIENSKKQSLQKNHLKQVVHQKQSLTTKKQNYSFSKKNIEFNDLELKGASLIKPKPSLSVNKYSYHPTAISDKSPLSKTGKIVRKTNINNNLKNLNPEKKFSLKNKEKNDFKILKFGEILNIYDMDDKNINVNEEVDNFLLKLEEKKTGAEDFEKIIKLDWFDVKSSNSFETLIDKLIEYFLQAVSSSNFPKDFKNYQKNLICFIFNGVEEFLFFDGILSTIFTNLAKIPFHLLDCLEILIVFLSRNSKKLYFLSEEKKESMLNVLILSIFDIEIPNLTEEIFLNVLHISENLLKNPYIRTFFLNNFQDFIRKLVIRCNNACMKNSNVVLKKSHLMEMNLLIICLKYPDFIEKIIREEFILNLINKLNNSLKIQREFPLIIIYTFKKIRKIITNYKLIETKLLNFERLSLNFNKMLKILKGVPLQESLKTIKKMNLIITFLTKK